MRYQPYIIYLMSLVITGSILAQPINNTTGDVVLPSAEAASLGKFGEIPVSHFHGIPSNNIHIYTVEQGPLQWPISLNYHSSGIRVAEIASWVGTGWSLLANAMISRSVVGIPDEKEHGWFSLSSLSGIAPFLIGTGQRDSEPDVFNFNIGSYSGKFVFAINAQDSVHVEPLVIPKQEVKITRIYGGSSLKGFKVVTPDGVIYYFGTITGSTSGD